MITVDSLTKKYRKTTVVDDISFVAPAGRVTGFLGPERGRQVHLDADDGRPHPAHLGHAPPSTAAGSPTCPTRAWRSA